MAERLSLRAHGNGKDVLQEDKSAVTWPRAGTP